MPKDTQENTLPIAGEGKVLPNDWVFEAIRAAYERGAMWRHENGTLEMVEKASYDFADKMTAPSSPGKDGGQEVEADKPVICIGRHTIDRLVAGQDVEIDAAIMIPASDLSAEPICHLVWRQGRISIDDVEDYYEVARRGDKSVDGSDPFPVFLQPASTALVESATAVLASWDERMGGEREEIRTYDRGGMNHEYWSPATSLVDSEAISKLRSALSASQSTSTENADV